MEKSTDTNVQAIVVQANDSLDVQHASISDLGSLFRAIRQESKEGSEAYRLAGMGMYLAEDWANMAEQSKIEFSS